MKQCCSNLNENDVMHLSISKVIKKNIHI